MSPDTQGGMRAFWRMPAPGRCTKDQPRGILMSIRTVIPAGLVVVSFLTGNPFVEAAPAKKFRVQVNINGQEDVKGGLAKLVQEEFAPITDVELVTEKPELFLELIGVAPRNEKKEPVVFLVSVLSSQHFSKEYWDAVYATMSDGLPQRQEQPEKGKRSLQNATKDLIRKQSHYVEGGNDLREVAKKIVAAFNHNQLDPLRKK
jgi:hypothetical protein